MSETLARFRAVEKTLEGWFVAESAAIWDALLAQQRQLGVRGDLMEVGVHRGRSAAVLALHAEPASERLVLVDPYCDWDVVRANLERVRPGINGSVLRVVQKSKHVRRDRDARARAGAVRWFHVDGGHTTEEVENDIALAHRFCSPEAVVAVDDFHSWLYPQITEALHRWVRRHPRRFDLFLCGFNKAYLARPRVAQAWRAWCRERLPLALEERGVTATVALTDRPGGLVCFGIGPRIEGLRLRGPDTHPDALDA